MGHCEIPLTQGRVALVDAADFERISQHRWYAKRDKHTFYAVRHGGQTTRRLIYMHREIVGGALIDHRNRDGLDNRRENLRPATHAQNMVNRPSASIYRGVRFMTRRRKNWQAQITVARRTRSLGYFATPTEAARAYNIAAVAAFGDFAVLNAGV